jgi:hypothetical protein
VRIKFAFILAAAAVASSVSCVTDVPSSPTVPSERAPANAASNLVTPITVVPLQRTSPLATAQSASARIGILGGRISLPDAGLTVTVPPLAVVTPVTITVTAPAGSDVAYEFSPHGLAFLAPLVATQDLHNTQAQAGGLIDPLSLYVGYFPDSSHPTTVTELLNLRVDLLSQTSIALLWHFSGYMWSSGREDDASASALIRRPGGRAFTLQSREGR